MFALNMLCSNDTMKWDADSSSNELTVMYKTAHISYLLNVQFGASK